MSTSGFHKRRRIRPQTGTRASQGFSLIELMAALSILTLGLLGAVTLFFRGMNALGAAEEAAIAARLARSEIEHRRGQPFSALEPVEDAPFAVEGPELERLPEARTRVRIADDPGTPGLKRVEAVVEWRGEHGRTIRKGLVTLVARRDAGRGEDTP